MWNDTLTLYIDDNSVRLLVAQGQKTRQWAEMRLEPGLVKGSVILQEKEVALRIRTLLKSCKVKKRRVALGFSGLHSLTRPTVLPQLPKKLLPEAAVREARRILPVVLDQLYLSWRPVGSPKGRTQLFIAATPRKIADSMIKTLRLAGLNPDRVTVKPLALTRALPVNSAILIDLQPGEFDIVILADGIAQPIRTVVLPEETISWEEKLAMIASDLERTIKFHDTNNPETPLTASVPVFVSGTFIEKPEMVKPLADATGRPVTLLRPALKGSEQLDMSRYGVNAAMILGPQGKIREATFPVASLNMLPGPYKPKPISITKVVGIPGGVVLAGILVPLLMMLQNNTANIANLQSQLDNTNQMVAQQSKRQSALNASIADLNHKVAAAQAISQNLDLVLQALHNQQGYVNGDIQVTLKNLPPQISISNISESVDRLTITGSAPTESDVRQYAQTILDYARSLAQSNRFSQSTVSSLHFNTPASQNGTSLVDFNLTFARGN